MKIEWPVVALLVVALLLGACGGNDDAEAPPEEGVFDDMTGTLDRAQEVEQKVLEQKERLDQALKEAERSEEEPES